MEKINFHLDDKGVFSLGAICALLAIAGILLDVIIGIMTGGNLTALPQTAADRFLQLNNNRFLGLYNLDLLNVIIQILLIPVWYDLFISHFNFIRNWSLLAFVIFLFGSVIMVSDNVALPMYELSKKFALADNETQKSLIAAAGEAMLARGVHGSTGMFFSFLLPNLAGIIISFVMLKARLFSRLNSWFGIVGFTLMVLYITLVTFVPGVAKSATAFALPGGILLLLWLIAIAIKLFRISTH